MTGNTGVFAQVKTPPLLIPGKSYIKKDPLGVVCIIAPWNFPIQLSIAPLIPAIAAGNCVVIKPSELAPSCAVLLQEMINSSLDRNAVKVIQGGVDETSCLLRQRFDHIFYTGTRGPYVGKSIV
jgi:aldehyde dehydrogenase (NAD+)